MDVGDFDFLCQSLSFLRFDEEILTPELKSELVEYCIAHSDDIIAKYASLPFSRQSVDSQAVIEYISRRSINQEIKDETEAIEGENINDVLKKL
jgi:hypothetical protein